MFTGFRGYPGDDTVSVYDTLGGLLASSVFSVSGPTPVFTGYSSPSGIGRVVLSSTSYVVTDNLELGPPAPAPEPSSVALGGLGAAGLILRARKRKAVA